MNEEIDVDKLSAELTELMEDFRHETPNWAPLEKVIPIKWCAGFMWMGETRGIHLYKHGFTRRYLNLDMEGSAYRYLGFSNRYERMNLDDAIDAVFEGLERMRKTRETPYDAEAVRSKHEQLAEVGWTTINVSPEGTTVTKPKPGANGSKPQARRSRKGEN